MKFDRLVSGLLLGLMFAAGPAFAQSNTQPLNTDGIAKAMGKEGELTGEMYRVSFPRSDLTVEVGNVVIKPALALMSWAAFVKSGTTAISYGDLVLLDGEINPVISKLEERGIDLSALHNHLLHENPRIMYIHFVARGDEVEIAKGIREALALTKSHSLQRLRAQRQNPNLPRRSSGSLVTRALWEEASSTSPCPAMTSTCTRWTPPSPEAWA
jgi:hypothetical protein